MKEKTIRFFKQETVLYAAFALAAGSMLFVHPDMEYLGYIDFRTLSILFCLMGVMAGLQKSGTFQYCRPDTFEQGRQSIAVGSDLCLALLFLRYAGHK